MSANPNTRLNSGFYENAAASTANGWPENDGWWHLLANTHSNGANYFSQQFASDFDSQKLYYRSTSDLGTRAWSRVALGDGGTYSMGITGNSRGITSQDTRSTNELPQDISAGIRADFKQNTTNGLSDG